MIRVPRSGAVLLLPAVFACSLAAATGPGPTRESLREMAAQLERAVAAGGGSARANLSLAAVYLKLGEASRAVKPAARAVALEPGNTAAKLALADAWLESGDTQAALPLFCELAGRSGVPEEAWYGLAKSALDLARQRARLLEDDPKAAEQWKDLRKAQAAFWARAGAPDCAALAKLPRGNLTAATDLRAAIQLEEAGLFAVKRLLDSTDQSARPLATAAALFSWAEMHAEAAELLGHATKREPVNGALWAALGKAQWRNVDFGAAERSLSKAIDLGASDAECYFALGDIVARNGRTQDAIRYFRKALDQDPDSTVIRVALAKSYGTADDNPAQIRELLAIPPEHRRAAVWYQLSRAYARDGNHKAAELALAAYRKTQSRERREGAK